jgi:hypothetical protein
LRRADESGRAQHHQVLGDPRCHQVGELGGQFANRQRAALGQQVEDAAARRIGQPAEQFVAGTRH